MELVNELYAFCGRTECAAHRSARGRGRDGWAAVERAGTIAVLKESVEALVRMISPFTPHMAEELWEMLGHPAGSSRRAGPNSDEAVAKAEEITVPVQINGKLRARLTVPGGSSPKTALRELAWRIPQVAQHLEGKTVKKVVVAGGRLVSIVVS